MNREPTGVPFWSPPDVEGAIGAVLAQIERRGVLAYPTETVYGLAADACNERAVRRLYAVKGRPTAHPVIALITEWRDKDGSIQTRSASSDLGGTMRLGGQDVQLHSPRLSPAPSTPRNREKCPSLSRVAG